MRTTPISSAIVLEAFCRNRPVVGTDVGGIADLVSDGENGLLVPPQDPDALAEALVRMLSDRELAERLGAGAREGVEPLLATPEQYARKLREIVDAVVSLVRHPVSTGCLTRRGRRGNLRFPRAWCRGLAAAPREES